MHLKKIFALLFFFSNCAVISQTVILKGVVKNEEDDVLSYATIIADSDNAKNTSFSIVDERGLYKIRLKKNTHYIITANYLGYKPKVIDVKIQKDSILNFKLIPETNELNEVVISYQQPIIIKQDTIKYRVNKFTTGNERKLKDVLRKLPGIEVDRNDNVFLRGKRISKVLVENKQFFTGESKLAVSNIPGNAIHEIEIIDNFNEIAVLKGLEDSNDIAMNVKLKQEKKKFWFGDLELGSDFGTDNRNLIHPSVFYYSPQKSINLIGDINNIGKKSFTFKDYLNFEGGYQKILLDTKSYFSKISDNFSQFLTNQNFKNSNHYFGGGSINYSINKDLTLIGYGIYSKSNDELESQSRNEYLNETSIVENRRQTSNPTNNFFISKVGAEKNLSGSGTLKISSYFKCSTLSNVLNNESIVGNTSRTILSNSETINLDFKQNLEIYKDISEGHTITGIANFNYQRGRNLTNWNSNTDIFPSIIPLKYDLDYLIFKNMSSESNNFSFLFKHYWVLGNNIHLYSTLGGENYMNYYRTEEFQKVSNGNLNEFENANFGNNVNFYFDHYYIGNHVVFQFGNLRVKPGIFFHNYNRKTTQDDQNYTLVKNYLLPEIQLKYEVNRGEKISLSYNKKVRFPSVFRLLKNYTLLDFNSVYLGNPTLENEVFHQANFYYYKFSLLKNLNYNFNVRVRKNEKGVRNRNILEGINFITQPILLDNSDESILLSGSLQKRYGNYTVSFGLNSMFSRNLRELNMNLFDNRAQNLSLRTGLKGNLTPEFNFDISYHRERNWYITNNSLSIFDNHLLDVICEYNFWDNFNFSLDFNFQNFTNQTAQSNQENKILNLSFTYNNENHPWQISLSANNALNNNEIRNSSFNDFLISEQSRFVLPRIFLLSFSYQL